MPLREQHARAGIEGIIDAPRALHGEPLRVGVAPRVHIGVAHLAPEMRRALFHRPHEFSNAQCVRQPFQLDAVLLFQFEQPLVGDKGVGAFIVRIDTHARLGHRESPEMSMRVDSKRMGPGAFKHRGARHLRFSEGFLIHISSVSGSQSAWPLRFVPAVLFKLSAAQRG